ncbi:hypothetical protein AB9Q10_18530 [Streptomyces krungchingensis]
MTWSDGCAKLRAVRRTFTVRSGTLFGLSVALLSFVALTWLPGPSLIDGTGWTMAVMTLSFVLCLCAAVPVINSEASRSPKWFLGRGLPGHVRATLGLLIVSGVVLLVVNVLDGGGALETPRALGDRYFATDMTASPRVEVEISRSRYEFEVEDEQRMMLVLTGLLCAGATWLILAIGAPYRQEAASRRPPHWADISG